MNNSFVIFKEKLCRFPILRPKVSLILGALLLSLFLPFVSSIQLDFSATVWFHEDDPHRQRLSEFEKTFGSDESVVILVEFHKSDVFSVESIALIEELTQAVWQLPYVQRVESLTNFQWSVSEGEELVSGPFIPEELLGDEEFLRIRAADAREHKVIPRVYVSDDFSSGMIYGRLAYDPYGESRDARIGPAVGQLVQEFNERSGGAWTLHGLGQPVLSAEFQRMSFLDLYRLTPILLLLVILYLYFTFRSFAGVAIPFSIILGSVGATAGLTGLLGFKVNSLTFILPSILVAISIADSIHLLATFFDQYSKTKDMETSAYRSLDKNLWPIFLTSVSTAIGFLSLCLSSIIPVRDLGVLAAFGTLSAMAFSYFWVTPLLLMFVSRSVKNNKPMNQRMLPRPWIEGYVAWVGRNRKRILLSFSLFALAGVYLGLQNRIDSNPYRYFKDHHPINIANEFTLEHYGGVAGPEIVIDSGELSGAKQPEFLKRVDDYQYWIEQRPPVNRVLSLIDILKEVNQALFDDDPDEYRIHPQADVIAQEIFLYTMGLPMGMDINNRIDLEERRLRLSVLWNIQDSQASLDEAAVLLDEARKRGLDAHITGKPVLFQYMNSYVVQTFFTSMALAVTLISLLLILVFRSFTTGLLSLIPNCIPVILGAAVLTLLNRPIDIGCAIVASVTLGIAVDDTIHFLSHFHKLRKEGHARRAALVEVLASTGLALIITTSILATCFGLFVFAGLIPNINFGILCAFVLTMALVCDLLVLPAIILGINPKSQLGRSL